MTSRSLLVILTAVALGACGRGADLDTRTFQLKYLGRGEVERLIEPYVYRDRPNAGGGYSVSSGAITVRETRDNLDKIARVLEEYDRPQPMVQLSFQVIEADGATTRDPAIADVEAVLSRLFRFRGYRLAAEGIVGGVEGSGLKQVLTDRTGAQYIITATIHDVRGTGDNATVELDARLQVARGVRQPATAVGGGEIQTVVRLPVGKTAVLGNTQAATAGGTLILTVRPELVPGAAP